jgi:transcriptional regulator with XRE-family HTH domain
MGEFFGERVCEARKAKGMSQKFLAHAIGISPTSLNQIEKGQTKDPGVSRLYGIAKTLKVSADYLLGLTKEAKP